jgi:hypothetical protein
MMKGPRKWFRLASGLLLIATGCAQPLATAVTAPQIPAGQARIWFYRGYEDPGSNAKIGTTTPTIAINGADIGPAADGSVFYRDVPAGHYDISIHAVPSYGSPRFELATGQQAYVKIILNRRCNDCGSMASQPTGFSARLVSPQVAETDVPSLAAQGGQRRRLRPAPPD